MRYIPDEEFREERYAALRIRKARCEKIFTVCLAASALLAAVEIMTFGTISSIALFGENRYLGLLSFGLNAGIIIFSLLGICYRKRSLTCAALLLWIAACLLHFRPLFIGSFVYMLNTLFNEMEWDRLRKKEGFPQFQIPFRELDSADTDNDLTVRNLPPPPAPGNTSEAGNRSFIPGEMDSI